MGTMLLSRSLLLFFLKVSMVKFKNSHKPNCIKLNIYRFPHCLLLESNKTDRRCLIIAIIDLQIM